MSAGTSSPLVGPEPKLWQTVFFLKKKKFEDPWAKCNKVKGARQYEYAMDKEEVHAQRTWK